MHECEEDIKRLWLSICCWEERYKKCICAILKGSEGISKGVLSRINGNYDAIRLSLFLCDATSLVSFLYDANELISLGLD